MKTHCETFGHWLWHPNNTLLICENRAGRFPECRRCKGIETPKMEVVSKRESVPHLILLDVDKKSWIEAVRNIQETYDMYEGTKKDETSARRIAALMGELYLSKFGRGNPKALLNVMIMEKDAFDLAMEYRLTCDPLEREERVKPHMRKHVLCTWGVDKTSGAEGYTSQLREWTAEALLGISETFEKEEDHGADREVESGRPSHLGSGPFEVPGTEEIGLG